MCSFYSQDEKLFSEITEEDSQENNNSLNNVLKNIKKLQSDFSEVFMITLIQ